MPQSFGRYRFRPCGVFWPCWEPFTTAGWKQTLLFHGSQKILVDGQEQNFQFVKRAQLLIRIDVS